MTNDEIRSAVIDAVRHDLEAHKLSDKAMPVQVKINVIYQHARTELVIDLSKLYQEDD